MQGKGCVHMLLLAPVFGPGGRRHHKTALPWFVLNQMDSVVVARGAAQRQGKEHHSTVFLAELMVMGAARILP